MTCIKRKNTSPQKLAMGGDLGIGEFLSRKRTKDLNRIQIMSGDTKKHEMMDLRKIHSQTSQQTWESPTEKKHIIY